MNLSIGMHRPAANHWAATRHDVKEDGANHQARDSKTSTGNVGETGGSAAPSAALLLHESAARSFWAARLIESAAPAPAGLNEQQRYDYYADSDAGRGIIAVEGDIHSGSEQSRALFVSRVQYLRAEGGPELFTDLTPRRASLSGEALDAYDAEVQLVMEDLRSQAQYRENDAEHPDARPDESLLYVIASQIVEDFGGDAARLDALLGDVNAWHLSIDNADGVDTASGRPSAGWYRGDGETATMQISLQSYFRQLSGPESYYNILGHELAHSLDISDGARDGIPVGMSAADATILREERARLFELAYPGETLDLSVNQDTSTIVDNSNLTDYGFTNEREFWARTSELFLGTDDSRERLLTASPELYNVVRRYYDRTDLPAAPGETELDDPALLDKHTSTGVFQDIDGELFVDGPDIFDVNQGSIANCYFVAGLASLAHTDPDVLRDMITDNGDGTFTVHFGGEAGDVTVDDDFAVDSRGRPLYAGTGDAANPELWVAVIEKAYAQTQGGYQNIEYGNAHEAIAEITGHDDFTVANPAAFTPEQIQSAIDEGRSVTASSYSGDTGDKKQTENGIVANHAYVVLGVRERNGVTEVQVYNPWGSTEPGSDGNDDGAFWMSEEDFNASFRQVQMMNTPLPEAA